MSLPNQTIQQHLKDFDVYSRALIASTDVDPVYPLVKTMVEYYDFEPEWFVFVYVAFYNLNSAVEVCEQMPYRESFDPDLFRKLRSTTANKFGHERRGSSRNVDVMIKHLTEAVDFIDAIHEVEGMAVEAPLLDSQQDFRDNLESMSNVGGWASFKIAELFEKSLDYKTLAIPDLGLDGRNPNKNDGPVGGLRWLFGRELLYDKGWFEHWNRFGEILASEWKVDIGEVESAMCKWHKMCSGKYYVGHDVDEFHELKNAEELLKMTKFPQGIYSGKLDKNLKKLYRDTGKIHNAHFADNLPSADVYDIMMSL